MKKENIFLLVLFLCIYHIRASDKKEDETVHTVSKSTAGQVVTKQFLLDSTIDDIQWAGSSNKIVVVKTSQGTLYRSDDDGKTWKYQMELLKGSLAQASGSFVGAGIAEILVSKANRDYIFFRGVGETHWITKDSGLTYTTLNPATTGSFAIKQVILHPSNPEWLIASKWSDTCKTFEKNSCNVEVYLSVDFGQSWRYLDNYVVQFSFGRPHRPEEIFMVRFGNQKTGNQKFGTWDKEADLFKSDNLWQSNVDLIPRGNRFLILGNFIFVAKVSEEGKNAVQLAVGREDKNMFEIARLPFQLMDNSYTILDTSEGAVFLHVNHGDFNTPYGDIYLSDADGWRYSLSLKNNRRDARGRCDFDKVHGLEGIYIANYIQNADAVSESNAKQHVVTVITFDKGGRWLKLRAPTHDIEGKETNCNIEEGCSLHLHGVTDEWSPFYSNENAIGLILSTGNLGQFLDLSRNAVVNTYFSRDGGQSWVQVRKGSHIYEIGNHGGLLIMAKDREPTDEVIYSWDEGLTWKSLPLAALTEVDNIITEPNSTSLSFVLYGSRGGVGVVVHLDFSTLHVKECDGIEAAGKSESSFELWTPTDSSSKCLLGRQVRYTRRKRAEECYVAQSERKIKYSISCPCTEEDYECDYGYERTGLSGACLALKSVSPTNTSEQCPPSGEYSVSKGYRLVAGDSCDTKAGVNFLPTVIKCSSIFSPKSVFSFSFLFYLILIIGVGYFIYDYYKKNPEILDSIKMFMDQRGKYHKLEVKPDTFSDDEFDIGESDENELSAHAVEFDGLGNGSDADNLFGPLPTSSGAEEVSVPVLQPPPASSQKNLVEMDLI